MLSATEYRNPICMNNKRRVAQKQILLCDNNMFFPNVFLCEFIKKVIVITIEMQSLIEAYNL